MGATVTKMQALVTQLSKRMKQDFSALLLKDELVSEIR